MNLMKLFENIRSLAEKKRAIILAHNYQLPEIQDVADFVGDSLELARKAMEIDADIIVLAGVRFMAEMVAVLNPDKIVIHPEPSAGCPLADFASLKVLRRYRERYPNTPLVVYVNSPISAKAEADYVVTSSSAVKLISKLDNSMILFGPDKNLADHVAMITRKKIIPIPPKGYCPIHEFLVDEYYVSKARREHPKAYLMVHPEAPRTARIVADYIGSTSQMLKRIGEVAAEEYLIGTEEALVYRARKLYPDKKIFPVNPRAVCIDMKKITLAKIAKALEELKPQVKIEEVVATKAREVIEKSLEIIG